MEFVTDPSSIAPVKWRVSRSPHLEWNNLFEPKCNAMHRKVWVSD